MSCQVPLPPGEWLQVASADDEAENMGENGYTFTLPETNIASETLRFQDEWNGLRFFGRPTLPGTTVDGQIPAPPRMMIIPLFIGF